MKTAFAQRTISALLLLCILFTACVFGASAEEVVELDTSEIEELIAQSAAVEAEKDKYMPATYDNYMNVINEAKTYYHGEHLKNFTQENVDAMADTIRAAYNNLLSADIGNPLRDVFQRYITVDCEEHATDPYSIETWTLYTAMITAAQNMLNSGFYYPAMVNMLVVEIDYYRSHELIKESEVDRIDSLNSAGFQTSYIYNDSTARIAVNTVKAYNIVAVMVFDENGQMLTNTKITVAPYNRRKPNQQIVYVDIPINGETGLHTYTVFAVDGEGLCSKYGAECTIEVRER